MIAVVSSTIFPGTTPVYAASRSVFTPDERLEQTRQTVDSLLAIGIAQIHIVDNSGHNWMAGVEDRLKPALVSRFTHYQFRNRGIAEIYMLLEVLDALPANTAILKISGRYALKKNITDQLGQAEVAAKWDAGDKGISTRCYMVRNKDVYRKFLEDTLDEVYGHTARISGLRSLMRIVKNSVFPSGDTSAYFDPAVSIEGAAARALVRKKYAIGRLADLGLQGEIATSRDPIRE